MRILITGGCGFLGSHIIEHLLRQFNHAGSTAPALEIVVLDKLTYASNGYDRLRDIGAAALEHVKKLNCDLSQPIPDGILREIGQVDYIIHAAAESHVDNSIVDPLPFLMSNVIGTHHLLMAARRMEGLRRIFLVSTDEVYGPAAFGDDVAGFDEQAPFRPANPYAAAKAGGEAVGMAYANTYRLPITIVNTMNLIGERQHPEKFVPLVIRKLLQGERVTIHADPTKTQPGTRFYLHCRTFADALSYLMRKDCFGALVPPIKVHVCGERELSNLDLAFLIAGFVGLPLDYELVDFHSSRPGHDLRYAMQDKLIGEMGWKRPMGIIESLEKTVRWYIANPSWLGLGNNART